MTIQNLQDRLGKAIDRYPKPLPAIYIMGVIGVGHAVEQLLINREDNKIPEQVAAIAGYLLSFCHLKGIPLEAELEKWIVANGLAPELPVDLDFSESSLKELQDRIDELGEN